MPQLDFDSFASQIFWLFVVYFLIYGFVSLYLTPLIFSIREDRANKLDADNKKSKEFENEIESVQVALAKLRQELQSEEEVLSSEHKKSLELRLKKEESKFERKLKKTLQNAEAALGDEIVATKNKIDDLVYLHASFMLEQLTGKKIYEDVLKNDNNR